MPAGFLGALKPSEKSEKCTRVYWGPFSQLKPSEKSEKCTRVYWGPFSWLKGPNITTGTIS
jgi:hypothetical protein